ncbi:purine-cytosine permease family protein [Pectobacterium versatile]|uniref:purine-cytosine permease family protein n=1 Tax=Pectobacterium versatile TaxID=2488639 RepID=UPI000CDE9560|nr:cytosine permease [Pectobacterium versatile]GKV79736.1 cytosine permease [Pectobacterium carotovorum subsp. carotovorum]AVT57564.1 nucleobase cation symporter-1 family protein [Pectobacterium versatile]MBQ4780922.1 cytosine permease [Pectobacterium versatile]MBQ4785479.1 cytosine permease [Pectobacterium versatile]POY58144.1 cytosine permease [Pectobacterium versatile]
MEKIDDYPVSRVPLSVRLPFLNVALVHIGMLTALDQFMLGAVLGHSMTLGQAFLAIFIGSAIFGVVTVGLGYAGMKEGMSGSLLARWCGFGRIGSVLIGLVIAVSLIGWFGVQNAVFAKALNFAMADKLGFGWSAALSGIALTLLVAFGFRALRFTAKIAVPMFVIVVGYISIMTLSGHNIAELIASAPNGEAISISAGATMVVGGCIVASLITPDMTRYSQKGKHVFWMTMLSIIVGEFIVNGLAIIIARALNTADVVTIMSQAAGGIGLIAVIFSTLRVNDINLYSSSLGIANAIEGVTGKKLRYVSITLVIGLIGTLLSVAGILDRFIDFLTLLGVLFPPIIGVMLVDYYILRTHKTLLETSRAEGQLPDSAQTPLIGWPAIIASTVGAIVGLAFEWGVPAFNSLLAASLLYLVIQHYINNHAYFRKLEHNQKLK